MVNYNQAYLESLVKPGSTRLSILVDNCQKPGKSGSTRVYQAHQAFNQTFGARDLNVGNKQNNFVYAYYETPMSIIFNTFHCLSRKCSTKLIKLFDFFTRVLLGTQNCLQWKLCWACFFQNTIRSLPSAPH